MSGGNQIFKRNGESLRFYIVRGATYVSEEGGLGHVAAEEVIMKIQAHGGQVVQDIDAAHIWIVDKDSLKTYQEYCMSDPDHRAEGPAFVDKSIRLKGVPAEAAVEKKPMHGRYPGKARFTEDDDELLCQWLAIKIPDRESGGRKGNKIYQQLVELAAKYPNGRWAGAKSHPWQSWRERYRKRADYFDARIEAIAAAARLTAGSRTAYRNDRRVNKRVAVCVVDEEQAESSVSEDEEQGEFSSSDIEVGQDESSDEQGEFVSSDPESDDGNAKVQLSKRRRPMQSKDARPARYRKTVSSSPTAGPSRSSSQAKSDAAPSDTQRTLIGSSRASSRATSIASTRLEVDLTMDSDSDA